MNSTGTERERYMDVQVGAAVGPHRV